MNYSLKYYNMIPVITFSSFFQLKQHLNKISELNGKNALNNSTQKILWCTYQQNYKKILQGTIRIQMRNSTTRTMKIFKSSVDHNAPFIKLTIKWIVLKIRNKPFKKLRIVALLLSFTWLEKESWTQLLQNPAIWQLNTPRETWKTISNVVGKNSVDIPIQKCPWCFLPPSNLLPKHQIYLYISWSTTCQGHTPHCN